MKKYPVEIVQPMGLHNPPSPCIKSEHVKKYLDFPFEYLNPVQSEFVEYLEDHTKNIVLAAPTSSGKTKCIEFFISEAIINHDKKALYIAPMKALADEKFEEWTSEEHTFAKYKIEILTGDFELTEAKKKNLLEANIIVLTPEMFNSKCRFCDQHLWLKNTVFVGDEIHLIGMEGRGDALEVGLIQYFENELASRALFISATIPNAVELKDWLNHLTKRETIFILSNYRPCKLNVSWSAFEDAKGGKSLTYAEKEINRMQAILNQTKKIKDESTLIFVGSKDFGSKLSKQLNAIGIKSYFYNADLEREKRKKIEKEFRSGELKVLVSTTALSWGINFPSRYVIISHTAFGLTPMEPANIHQSIGRAGRAGLADQGDAIIFCEKRKLSQEKSRIFGEYKISSTLNNTNTLCFHILSYIVNGHVKNGEDLLKWYKKTLAYIQNPQINSMNAQQVLDNLSVRGMIKFDKDKKEYTATKLGEITARMYMSPLDVSDWFKNFSRLKFLNPPKGSDQQIRELTNLKVAMAFSECYQWGRTWYKNEDGEFQSSSNTVYMAKRESECTSVFNLAKRLKMDPQENPHLKYTACFLDILNGDDPEPELSALSYSLLKDGDRIIQTLRQIDDMVGKNYNAAGKCMGFNWGNQWDTLLMRLKYGVSSEMIDLVKIDGIGKTYAKKLYDMGVKDINDFKIASNKEQIEKVIGKARLEKILTTS